MRKQPNQHHWRCGFHFTPNRTLVLVGLVVMIGCAPAPTQVPDAGSEPRFGPPAERLPLEPLGDTFEMSVAAVMDGGGAPTLLWQDSFSGDTLSSEDDGPKLAVDRNPKLRLQWPAEYPSASIKDLEWSPDGQTLAVGGTIVARQSQLFHSPTRLYAANGQFERELFSEFYTMSGEYSSVSDLAWSPDGRTLAAAGGINFSATLFDIKSDQRKELTDFATSVFQVAWSPSGEWFVLSTGDRDVYLFDAAGELQSTVGPARGPLSWHPNGSRLAAVDQLGVLLFNLIEPSGDQPAKLAPQTRIELPLGENQWAHEARWSPDGSRLAACGFGTGDVWLMDETGQPIANLIGHTESVFGLDWSIDNELATSSADLGIRLWNQDGSPIAELWDESSDNAGIVDKIRWSPNGDFLAVPSPDHVVRIHTSTGDPVTTLASHQGLITAIAWHPDGQRIATADDDEVTLVWQLSSELGE
ncbi:MAG: hypothetical protein AAGC97_11700 [Planctomycetota bacterium]